MVNFTGESCFKRLVWSSVLFSLFGITGTKDVWNFRGCNGVTAAVVTIVMDTIIDLNGQSFITVSNVVI